MRNCVRVARQTLTLFVWVQILVPQPALRRTRFVLGSAFFYPLAHTAGHVFALPFYGVTPDPICFGFGLFLSLSPHRSPCFRFIFLRRDARPDLFWVRRFFIPFAREHYNPMILPFSPFTHSPAPVLTKGVLGNNYTALIFLVCLSLSP